jgi:hypothetical protein
MLVFITIFFLFINFCTVMYAAVRHTRKTRLWEFWLSTLMFLSAGTLMYFNVISEYPMWYVKALAAFLGLDFIVLIFDFEVWLPTLLPT